MASGGVCNFVGGSSGESNYKIFVGKEPNLFYV